MEGLELLQVEEQEGLELLREQEVLVASELLREQEVVELFLYP